MVEDIPSFLPFFAEKIGKPLSEFTNDDWKEAAFQAARFLDELVPPRKLRGRPRKRRQRTLADLMRGGNPYIVAAQATLKRPPGRPRAQYGKGGKYSKETIAEIVAEITSPEARRRWPDDAPRSISEAVRKILHLIGHPVDYAKSVERAVRRVREGGQKSKNNSR